MIWQRDPGDSPVGVLVPLYILYDGHRVGPQEVVDESPREFAEKASVVLSRIYEENSY